MRVACPGATAAPNPFQSQGGNRTAFGQGSTFGQQPPLPPGGLAGAPPLPGGFGGGASGGNPFGQKKTRKNGGSAVFGSAPFGQGSAAANSTPHTAFGTASGGQKQKNRGPAFGSSDNAFGGGNTAFGGAKSTFGGSSSSSRNSQPFGGNDASIGGRAFGGNDAGFGGAHTRFGAPKREKGFSTQDNGGFGTGASSAGAPAPLSSPGTSFGSQSAGMNVRKKKQITPNNAAALHSANPFAAASSGQGSRAPTVQTAFGGASSSNAFQSPSFGRPSPDAAGSTKFRGAAADSRRQSTPTFGSEASFGGFDNAAKMSQMESRMNGAKKSSYGKGKRAQGVGSSAAQDTATFGGQQMPPSSSRKFSGHVDGAGANPPKPSPTNGRHGKHRQPRSKTKAPTTSDEDTESGSTAFVSTAVAQDDNKAELSEATNLNGLCVDMCSPAERELHIRVEELSVFEKCFPDRPGTEQEMIIKRFQRSSADHKLDIPQEIRPPGVLRRTQLYIEQEIMDLEQFGPDPRFQPPRIPELIDLYNFCWDRFRMIRKDFVLQNYRGAGGRVHPIALDVHERIARYHVLSEHELIEVPSFVAQQNMEQLGQTLKSLNELYDESHKMGDPAYSSPFEAECRAYFILCTLDNGRGMDVLKYVKDLPHYILESPHIKFAMRVFVARHTGDYFQFFSLLRQATYLQSCLLFRYIPNVRSSALLRMNRAYRGQLYPLEDLVELLCFDDIDHAYSVCQQHKLRISGRPGAGDDGAIVIKFGGDFETDVQLRRSNEPLEVRGSKIYVGMKQGNYLRRDVCRGITEYASDEYPGLSKLIQDFERDERAKLYPSRPEYEDTYSYFVDYREGLPGPSTSGTPTPASAATGFGNEPAFGQQPVVSDQKKQELSMIAKRKLELEKKQQEVLKRIQLLEQAKKEKARQDQEKQSAAELAAQKEEQAKAEAIARAKAEQEAEESKKRQLELEKQLREQKKQRELEEQRKRAEEAAREAERQRIAAIQQAEALRLKAIEEERRRQEEIRQAELRRKAAEELERRRQQELAEERARREREAALEAIRQAQLAKEREERKRIRRAEKQRLAVLKLRLHIWKKYVEQSRNSTGPVVIDATRLRLERSYHRANESVQWLFEGSSSSAGVPFGNKRVHQIPSRKEANESSDSALPSLWEPEDIVGVVSAALRRQNPVSPSIAWKLVIADLLDADSSFGLWCAVRAGTQDSSSLMSDCHRTFQSNDDVDTQGVAVCCRYLTGAFAHNNTREVQQQKLCSTSAILLPVDLKSLQAHKNCGVWEQRLLDLLSSLSEGCCVTLTVMGFVSGEFNSPGLLAKLESCVRRVQSRYTSLVGQVSFELIHGGAALSEQFGQALAQTAALSPPVRQLRSVGLKELLEESLKTVINQHASSVAMQTVICSVFPRVRQDILSSGVMDLAYPPPELQLVVLEPQHGWNSLERQHEIRTVLTALEVTRVTIECPALAVKRESVCDVYFNKIVDFVDRLFRAYPASTAVSTYELKKRIYGLLVPVHELLTMSDGQEREREREQVSSQEADDLVPWKRIFEEVYGAFFETLDDMPIYYPAVWRGPEPRTFRLLHGSPSPLPKPLLLESHSVKHKVQPPAKVSLRSVQRSFGSKPLSLVGESLQEYRAVGEMKRLRVEIEKERAATSQFQRMLRQELQRWSADDTLL